MSNLNLKVIVGDTKLAPAAYEKLQPALNSAGVSEVEHREDADFRLVLGGDGTTMREARHNLTVPGNGLPPIFPIKAGSPTSKGMMLNDIINKDPDEILEAIRRSLPQRFHYLRVALLHGNGETEIVHAFNEVNTMRQTGFYQGQSTGQSGVSRILRNDRIITPRAKGDGVIVCTPQGSTAYNLYAGGSVATALDTIQVTGICSNIKSLVLDAVDRIKLEIIDPEKRPQRAEVDGVVRSVDVREIKAVRAETASVLHFIEELSYIDKMIAEAQRHG